MIFARCRLDIETAGRPAGRRPPAPRRLARFVLVAALASLVTGIIAPARMTGIATVAAATAVRSGVNVEPSMRPSRYVGANPQSWWCAPPECTPDFADPVATIRRELTAARAAGAVVVRLEIPWPLLEPRRQAFDWARADAIVSAADAAGETLLPVLLWVPAWAGGGSTLNHPPSDTSDWTDFVRAVVTRYGAAFRDGIEVWNEPDDGNYLADGSPRTYAEALLDPAYSVIKAAAPATPVILAGSAKDAGGCCPWVAALLAGDAEFDVAAFHDYAGNSGDVAAALRSMLDAHGRQSTPIWLTEYGTRSDAGDQSQTIRSVLTTTRGIVVAVWYNLRDTNSYTCCPPSVAAVGHWGLLNADGTEKPSYATMRILAGAATDVGTTTPSVAARPSGSAPPATAPAASSSNALVVVAVGAVALLALSAVVAVALHRRSGRT